MVKMKNKIRMVLIVLTLLSLSFLFISKVSAADITPYSYYGEDAGYFFPSISLDDCSKGEGQDFLVQIMPGSCQPIVVRSDLLEEQNVPVFCRLIGVKLNPLIEVPRIKSIILSPKTEKNIVGTTFHPYRMQTSYGSGILSPFSSATGSPAWDNLGYLVVVLKSQPVEAKMSEFVEENLTAKISYDFEKSSGINLNQRALKEMSDADWKARYSEYGFWNGRGYVRALQISEDSAKIAIYNTPLGNPIASYTLKKGDEKLSYMPGFYCSGGIITKLDDITYPQTTARLIVNGDVIDAAVGEKFADGLCEVKSIEPSFYDVTGKVTINCQGNPITLSKESIKVRLALTYNKGSSEGEFNIGDVVYQNATDNFYLVSAGRQLVAKSAVKEIGFDKFDFVIVAKVPRNSVLQSNDFTGINKNLRNYFEKDFKTSFIATILHDELTKKFIKISSFPLFVIDSTNENKENAAGLQISIKDLNGMINTGWPKEVEDEYKKSIDAYNEVIDNWPATKSAKGESYGVEALTEAAKKAKSLQKFEDEAKFLNKIISNYEENETRDAKRMLADMATSPSTLSSATLNVADKTLYIELSRVEEPNILDISASISVDRVAKTYYKYSTLDRPLDSWTILDIKEKEVVLANVSNHDQKFSFALGQDSQFMNHQIRVAGITMNKVAKISITPFFRQGVTYANFTFRAYIEKRAIKLSPEQTKDAINALNKSIAGLGNLIDTMGKYLQTWKTVCLVTSGALWVENFIQNLVTGEGAARTLVMRGNPEKGFEGWTQKCSGMIGSATEGKKYRTFSECYANKSKEIRAEIDMTKNAMSSNKDIFDKAIEAAKVEGTPFMGFSTSVTDPAKLIANLPEQLLKEGKLTEEGKKFIPATFKFIKDGTEVTVTQNNITNIISKFPDLYSQHLLFEDDARTLLMHLSIVKQCETAGKVAESLCEKSKEYVADKVSAFKKQTEEIGNIGGYEKLLTDRYGMINTRVTFIGKAKDAYSTSTTKISIDDFNKSKIYSDISANLQSKKFVDEFLQNVQAEGAKEIRFAWLTTGTYFIVLLKERPDSTQEGFNFYRMQVVVKLTPGSAGTAPAQIQPSSSTPQTPQHAPPFEMPATTQQPCATPPCPTPAAQTCPECPPCNLTAGYGELKGTFSYLKSLEKEWEIYFKEVNKKNAEFANQMVGKSYAEMKKIEGEHDYAKAVATPGSRRELTTDFGKHICYYGFFMAHEGKAEIDIPSSDIEGIVKGHGSEETQKALSDAFYACYFLGKGAPEYNYNIQNAKECTNKLWLYYTRKDVPAYEREEIQRCIYTGNVNFYKWEKENCVTKLPAEIKPVAGSKEEKEQKGGEAIMTEVGAADINGVSFIKEPLLQCDNPFTNAQQAKEIKFWESEPYKGLVAQMPVDTKAGWYAATMAYGAGMEAYMESGKLKAFYICNVGKDGKIDFNSGLGAKGDDKCALIFFETWQAQQITLCPDLDAQKSAQIISKAIGCMTAASQYFGKKKVHTACGDFDVGSAPVALPTMQCEDFMSTWQCDIMYNVCDPVICPSSRCNLGGAYTVDNVVQTGVIGSLALCFPNFGIPPIGGHVLVPICLTGVHAGLDGWLIIMKAAKACLEESLATGKEVGICDELKSVYLCEFFWKQLSPFLKVGVPALINAVTGTTKAGGEYLNINTAYKNAVDSATYITDYYGVNAWKAFKARTTGEAGTTICKAFVSLSYPNQANLFDELTKPESPPQINAWFSETSMQTITTPAISQYKVYWRIFAGRDQSVYYVITLSEPPMPTYYNIPETQNVASGFIAKGEYVDITKDMQVASGYKKICVQISGAGIGVKNYCGFGKVEETFAINELTGLYAKEQAAQQITTEKDCISGTASLLPLATSLISMSNIQAGVQKASNPEIYKEGIIRVCSSDNPGQGVNPDNWNRIGFCNEAKTVGCWLDKQSVKGVIKDLNLLNMTFTEAENISNQLLDKEANWDDTRCGNTYSIDLASKIKEYNITVGKINTPLYTTNQNGQQEKNSNYDSALTKLAELEKNLSSMVEKCITQRWKARAQLEIGDLHDTLVEKLSELLKSAQPVSGAVTTPTIKKEEKVEEKKIACAPVKIYWANETRKEISKSVIGQKVILIAEGCDGYSFDFDIKKREKGLLRIDALKADSFVYGGSNVKFPVEWTITAEGEYYFDVRQTITSPLPEKPISSSLLTVPEKLEYDIFFDYNSSSLTTGYKNFIITALNRDFGKINENAEILIDGWASEEGSVDYNIDLSKRRALNVSQVIGVEFRSNLVKNGIILRPVGHGKTTQFGEPAKNRVVVISVKNP